MVGSALRGVGVTRHIILIWSLKDIGNFRISLSFSKEIERAAHKSPFFPLARHGGGLHQPDPGDPKSRSSARYASLPSILVGDQDA